MKSKISLMFVAACSALCIASLPAQAGSASRGSATSTKISGVKIGSKVSKGSTIVTTADETQGQGSAGDSTTGSRALVLSTDAGSCTVPGSRVNVTASLSGVYENVVAGQIWLTWDSSKLTLNSIAAGDAPFVVNYTINQSAGTALILASITPGSNGGPVVNAKAVAKLAFTATGENCSGAGNKVDFFPAGTMPTIFTDGYGTTISPALTASAGFTVDGTKPVLSGAVDVTQNADAGDGPFAVVAITKPTANDNCAGATSVSGVRSDSLALTAKYPVGTTVITWSSTDACGNTGNAYSNIVVSPYNTVKFNVTYALVFNAAANREFKTSVRGDQINHNATVSGVPVAGGGCQFFVTTAPIDNYSCSTVEDAASTLRRKGSVTDTGTVWSVDVTLVSGDIINDELVDVLDWGAYVVRNPNADLNMDGSTNASDGDIIIANFGAKGDAGCGSSFTGSYEPIMAISVSDLVSQGLVDLVGADLNNDGWLDMEDVRMGTRGARLNRDGWVDVAVTRSAN